MKAQLVALTLAGCVLMGCAPQALAEHRPHRGHVVDDGWRYDRHHDVRHYRYGDYRRYMPRWLRRDNRFRAWYRHTPLKYNHHLGWGELYSIYRWERRYSNHRRYHHYGKHRHRGFDYYRKFWKRHHRHKRRAHRGHFDDRPYWRRYGDRYDDRDDDDRRERRRYREYDDDDRDDDDRRERRRRRD